MDSAHTGERREMILRHKSQPYARHMIELASRKSIHKGRHNVIIKNDLKMEHMVSLILFMGHRGYSR